MVVGLATVTMHVPMARSLKDKRRVVKSVAARVRAKYNVAVAEVDTQDSWQTITLGIACVSTERSHAQAMLGKVMRTIEHERLDAELLDFGVEYL